MPTCSSLYKSKMVQSQLKKSFKENANLIIKEEGGLPAGYWTDYKKGFKQRFMQTCKSKPKGGKSRKNYRFKPNF